MHETVPPEGMDPAMWAILKTQPSLGSSDVGAMRDHAVRSKRPWNEGAAQGLEMVDRTFRSSGGDRPIREIRPPHSKGAPIVHVHGGGWATCDLDTHLAVVAGLARASGRCVLAPHARRAPEAPYPAPLADTIAALRFFSNAHPDGFFLSGDSAGANLALAALLMLRDTGEALPVRSAALFYGCYRRRFDTPTHIRYGDGRYGLSTEKMAAFWNLYAPDGTDTRYADLEGHDMTGLPPLQIHAAQTDILRADSQWLADKVRDRGGTAALLMWNGMAHGFLHYPSALSSAREATARAAEFFEATQ